MEYLKENKLEITNDYFKYKKMDNLKIEKINANRLMDHINEYIEKVKLNKYWDIKINKNVLLNNYNYSCIIYVITHYEIFSYDICKNYNCYYCDCKSSNVILDYNKRAKILNTVLDHYCGDYISLNNIIIKYLFMLKIKSRELFFCCPTCKRKDTPAYLNISSNENTIIECAYRIRNNVSNSNKWKKHKVNINDIKKVKLY